MDETIKTDTAAAPVVRGHRKTRVGNVISDAQNKTIVVEIVTRSAHPRYKKVVKSHVRYAAHDENNEAKVGDIVEVMETRPLSRDKHFRLVRVIEKAVIL